MNPILTFVFIFSIILGLIQGRQKMTDARKNNIGVYPSDNIFKFLFCDRY